jgi:Fe-S cluster assembly protein SufD
MTAVAQLENWLENFTEAERSAPGRALPWLKKLREDAFGRFCDGGFPTTKDEDWRFTNVSAIARTQFRPAGPARIAKSDVAARGVEGAAAQLVFVNGRYAPELSSLRDLPKGVTVASLAETIGKDPAGIEMHLGRYANQQRDSFVALNTAFVADGAYVHVARGVVVEKPIALLYLTTEEDQPTVTHPRNLIVAEDESQVAVVEDYVSHPIRDKAGDKGGAPNSGGAPIFSNAVTELVAGESAHVQHYLIEREHLKAFNVSTLRIQQGRSANVASHSVLLGGGLVRNNVHPVLAGEGGECLINGLFLGTGRQHLDNYMHVEHAAPHCGSRQFYNGILDGQAHGVFHGRIVVHKDAQKTDAKQTNRNLLLSDDAQIDTKPQLEIYADDVKCTHGATIGQIEENALFYLQSRGISETEARKLLLMAFAEECVDRMQSTAAREHVVRLIRAHLLFIEGVSVPAKGEVEERVMEEVG